MDGMFQMINQGIQQSPLAGSTGQGLLDLASMGLGGALGTAMGRDPGSFMSQGGRSRRADQSMASIDWENPDSITAVAQQMAQAGRMEEAQRLMDRVDAIRAKQIAGLEAAGANATEKAQRARAKAQKRQAIDLARTRGDTNALVALQANALSGAEYLKGVAATKSADAILAKQVASLEAAGAAATEKAQRARAQAQKRQAIDLARTRGDTNALAALQSGAISGAEYLKGVAATKRGTTKLGEGDILVDEEEGTVIARNPKELPDPEDEGYKLTTPDKNEIYKSQEAWGKNSERATQAQATADAIKAMPSDEFGAGAPQTASEWINTAAGTRDKAQQLRTQYLNIQKSGIVQAMPSGPQSDNDVRIFSRGFPPENAGREEVVQFLEAQARIAQKAADYEEMKIEYITMGKQGDFIRDWKRRMAQEAEVEKRDATPPGAIEALKANPSLRDDFLLKYGWLPEGM